MAVCLAFKSDWNYQPSQTVTQQWPLTCCLQRDVHAHFAGSGVRHCPGGRLAGGTLKVVKAYFKYQK